MTSTTQSSSKITEQQIRAFEQRYGPLATDLAAHAAFPLTLTTDLVYCLRETFLPQCPWYAAADVLLSGLCTVVGYDLYEMEAVTRRYLLSRLRDRFGESQVYEVERFMVAYLRHRIKLEDSDRPLILGEKPNWTSLACLRPGDARDEIQQTLQQLTLTDTDPRERDPRERFRLAALVESYGDFLADQGFQPLLVEWADRVAEGEPIDETADLAARLVKAGFGVRLIEFEVATITFDPATVDKAKPNDTLQSFEFETVIVDDRGKVVLSQTRQAFYFVELLEGVPSLELVAIPSGEFMMGSPVDEPERYDDESPQHQVSLPPFFISKYPITQAQWRSVAKLPQQERELTLDPANFKGDERPVEQVSWYEAVEFCRRLSEQTGRNYRLPTEAEWEYACRAGTTTPFSFGETITTELANYDGSVYRREAAGEERGQTTPVGQFLPNAFGLYDMHGNVEEWCLDHWHSNYEEAPMDGSAWLTDHNDARRVRRGGSWVINPRYCRSAVRFSYIPGDRELQYRFSGCLRGPRTLSIPLLFFPLSFFSLCGLCPRSNFFG